MSRLDIEIPAPDGTAKGTLHLPDRDEPSPGVVLFPDAVGFREVMRAMGDKLAGFGYVTLVPDVYYRAGDWAPFDIKTIFSGEERARLGKILSELTNDRIIADARAYADFLLARPEVAGDAIGTTGYCMGGRLSLIVAGGLGDTIGAAASFHGGGLAVDDPSSPHHAAKQIKAAVYVAGATGDDHFPVAQADLLESALTEAGVRHTIEFYNAGHGFAVQDNPAHDLLAETRHWAALLDLYAENLRAR